MTFFVCLNAVRSQTDDCILSLINSCASSFTTTTVIPAAQNPFNHHLRARLGFRRSFKGLAGSRSFPPFDPPPSDLYLLLHLRCHSWICKNKLAIHDENKSCIACTKANEAVVYKQYDLLLYPLLPLC